VTRDASSRLSGLQEPFTLTSTGITVSMPRRMLLLVVTIMGGLTMPAVKKASDVMVGVD